MANPPAHVYDQEIPEEEVLSTISIQIKVPIYVSGNNNVLSIDPAVTGSKIAVAIVTGLRQMSGIAGGVPMIDENGRPRPIIVDVDGITKIDGSDNIIGDRAVYTAGGGLSPAPPKIPDPKDLSKKRDRPDGDDSTETDSKRPRTENASTSTSTATATAG